jgi:hypothetical protein
MGVEAFMANFGRLSYDVIEAAITFAYSIFLFMSILIPLPE